MVRRVAVRLRLEIFAALVDRDHEPNRAAADGYVIADPIGFDIADHFAFKAPPANETVHAADRVYELMRFVTAAAFVDARDLTVDLRHERVRYAGCGLNESASLSAHTIIWRS